VGRGDLRLAAVATGRRAAATRFPVHRIPHFISHVTIGCFPAVFFGEGVELYGTRLTGWDKARGELAKCEGARYL
jgi:hypothetical protein